ncbi:3-oxoacyl-(acyl carrier) synthase II (macronuclear) [Tetrahymena thermophila SB210]|uniref:beta-ketoacyl-[acyl-carrier-protein] synthase I n=1 Tax=Tetrahymena thermophila (strain SB210) TaxID=312017 RepID=I7MJQ6_TETTS|nr:3-oxoacyl-(acyl carrier) synthase II [Tetrahymena thermophila SB210]EAR96536.1 3-oxoacyl-(acyl carrier) synthase II [Tetrahymena thermophila SB210]|eukprot:XP_001016781.1 3-oxoacyl-(acyl carrier) synthase II [Tetrahymena thermophila SB210]
MKQLKRVVVTGIGAVSPIGLNASSSWESLIAGKSGIISTSEYVKKIQQNDPTNKLANPDYWPLDTYVAAVPDGFDNLKKWKVAFSTNNTNSYAMAAANEAIEDSGIQILLQNNESLQNQAGVNIGVMSSNISKLTEIVRETEKKGFQNLNRLTILQILTNMATANVSLKYQLKGPSGTASTACATGASAIGDAFRNIQFGDAKIMIAGGSEDSLSPTNAYASMKLQAMTTKKYDKPEFASRPFDADRSGFVLGEGAGILVLEELQHALSRNAKIYAELVSYGQSSDGYHLTRPIETGEGGLRAMQNAINHAQINSNQINLINCHATSTPAGDLAEIVAINKFFDNNLDSIKNCLVTANKGAIGHTFGAAGAIESIFTILSIKNGISPLIKNLQNPISEPFVNLSKETVSHDIKYALKNSFGFGGVNVSLLFKKFE